MLARNKMALSSLKVKISLFICLLLIGSMGTLSFISFNTMSEVVTNKTHTNTKALNTAIQGNIDGFLTDSASLVLTMGKTEAVRTLDQGKIEDLFNAVVSENKNLAAAFLGFETQKELLMVPTGNFPPDFDARKRGWYVDAKAKGQLAFTDVYIDASTQKPVVSVTLPIYDAQGNFAGALGIDVGLDKLTQMVNTQKIGESGFIFLTDAKGQIIAHPNEQYVKESKDLSKQDFVQKALSGESNLSHYVDEQGVENIVYFSQIPSTKWGLFVVQPEAEAYAEVNAVKRQAIIFTLVILAVALGVGYLVAQRLIRTIKTLDDGMNQVAQGDLTNKINITSNDELGNLATSINKMVENLKEIIGHVKASSSHVAGACNDLTEMSKQTNEATSKTTQEITQVASAIQQISATSEEVAASAQEAASNASDGQVVIREVTQSMEDIKNSSDNAAKAIAEVDHRAREIGRIVEMITQVADQTNLLALNAAIEAARAGEQGRGFAVVAEEVRKLAEQTTVATREISELISNIQNGTKSAVEIMQESASLVDKGNQSVTSTGSMFSTINEIVSSLSEQLEQSSRATYGVSSSIQNVAAVSEEQFATMEEVTASTEKLSQMANDLKSQVEKFKV